MRAGITVATALAFIAALWSGVALMKRSEALLEPGTTEEDIAAYMVELLEWADELQGSDLLGG